MQEWLIQTGRIDATGEDFARDELVVRVTDEAELRRFERALDRRTGRQGPILDWQALRVTDGRVKLGYAERHGSRMGTTLGEWMNGRPLDWVDTARIQRCTPAEALRLIGIA